MTISHDDDYQVLDTSEFIEDCPCCGSKAALWRYLATPTSTRVLMVNCSNGEKIGPQDHRSGLMNTGCLLYDAPSDFHKLTEREAIKYWNEYAVALRELRDKCNVPTVGLAHQAPMVVQ